MRQNKYPVPPLNYLPIRARCLRDVCPACWTKELVYYAGRQLDGRFRFFQDKQAHQIGLYWQEYKTDWRVTLTLGSRLNLLNPSRSDRYIELYRLKGEALANYWDRYHPDKCGSNQAGLWHDFIKLWAYYYQLANGQMNLEF